MPMSHEADDGTIADLCVRMKHVERLLTEVRDGQQRILDNAAEAGRKVAVLERDVGQLQESQERQGERIGAAEDALAEMRAVKLVVYGLVGAILLAVVGALVALVLRSGDAVGSTSRPAAGSFLLQPHVDPTDLAVALPPAFFDGGAP